MVCRSPLPTGVGKPDLAVVRVQGAILHQTSHSAGPGSGARAARRFRVAGCINGRTCLSRARVDTLMHYLYTDTPLAVGDPRLSRLTADAFADGRLQPTQALHELQTLRLARTPSRGPNRCVGWCSSTVGTTAATEYPLLSRF